jgi:hypothetical protein
MQRAVPRSSCGRLGLSLSPASLSEQLKRILIAASRGGVLVEGRSKNSNWASGRPPEKQPAEPTGFDPDPEAWV